MKRLLVLTLVLLVLPLAAAAQESPTPAPKPAATPAPQSAEDFFELAVTRFQNGDLAGSERHLRTAIGLQSRFAEAHYLLARVQVFRAAQKNKLLIENRGTGSAQLPKAGQWTEGHNDLQAAVSECRTVIGLQPSNTDAWLLLATALDNMGQDEEAENAYKQTINLNPASQNARDAHNNYGLLLVTKKRWSEAKGQFDEALALDPAFGPARLNLEKLKEKRPKLFK
jgi:Tfp pilus assembly protein PilF